MGKYIFHSILKQHIQGFLDQKRALGYKYDVEEYIMHRFDEYWNHQNGTAIDITNDSLEGWLQRSPSEGITSRSMRISVVRQFTMYLNGIGIRAYVPTEKYRKSHPVIHVLSEDEIRGLFDVIDQFKPKRPTPETLRLSYEYPVIFRLILTTGLRKSEAIGLHIHDVDWNTGAITVLNAKGGKDRIAYMSSDMLNLLTRYREYRQGAIGEDCGWLFPSVKPSEHISGGGLTGRFRIFWNQTSFAHRCEKSPTIHSLRHTYVVHRMNLWMKAGVDLQVMMPYLSRQLGHVSSNETFYYYHQVMDAFQVIQSRDKTSSAVMPEVRAR